MDVTVTNCRFVQPFVEVRDLMVPMIYETVPRGSKVVYLTIDPTVEDFEPITQVFLSPIPQNPNWVEVWLDGFRMINTTLDFGDSHTAYEVTADGVLKFKTPLSEGNLKIIMDGPFGYDLPDFTIQVRNRQGAKTKNTVDGQALVSYFCEPIILTEPVVGFVRLTDDRKSLVYIPPANFEGYDAFSYAVYTDRGQLSEPKCVYVTIGEPKKEEEEPEEGDEDTESDPDGDEETGE